MKLELLDENLTLLRKGELDARRASALTGIPVHELADALRAEHPIVFQEHEQGRKSEVGLAEEVTYRKFASGWGRILRYCYLLSAYDDAISGITWATSIKVEPAAPPQDGFYLSFGSGYKLDRTGDGWTIHALRRRTTLLSRDVLAERGWNFDLAPRSDASPARRSD